MTIFEPALKLLANPAFQWIFAIAGMLILLAVAYYVIERVKEGKNAKIPSSQENLAEFERMYSEGNLDKNEYQVIKDKLSREILEKTKRESR